MRKKRKAVEDRRKRSAIGLQKQHSIKSVKTQLGKADVKISSDRNGEYEPKIIARYDRSAMA